MNELFEKLNTKVAQLTMSQERRARFLEIWCSWLSRGYSTAQTAEGMAKVYAKQPEGAIALSAKKALAEGLSASDGFRGWFPDSLVHAIALYESSGTLLERREDLLARIRKGNVASLTFLKKVGYGLLLLGIVAIMYITVVNGTLIPAIISIVPREKWNTDIRTLALVAEFLSNWWWAILASGIGTIFLGSYLMPRWKGASRELVDKLPGMAWYRCRKGASILQNMSLLVQAGDSWRSAAQRVIQNETAYGRFYLNRFIASLAAGQPAGTSLSNMGCLDQSVSYQIILLQDELDLPVMAESIAEDYDKDSLKRLELAAGALQMFLFAVVGGGIIMIFSGSYGILGAINSTAGF